MMLKKAYPLGGNLSTKIYDAYRVCDNKIKTVFKIKKELEALYNDFVCKSLEVYGRLTLNDCKELYSEGCVFWDIINRDVWGLSRNEKDAKFAMPIKELPPLQYFKQLINTHILSDWHYQNSTDKPDNVRALEWRKRERMWKKVLGWNTPAMSGFCYNFFNRMIHILSDRAEKKEARPPI